jgi:hypothetical protein
VRVDPAAVLGSLSPIFVPPSGFLITPFVTALPERPGFQILNNEVAELIETPLSALFDPATVRRETWTVRGIEAEIPFFQIGPHKVWGATAMVLSEFAMAIQSGTTKDTNEHKGSAVVNTEE